ncbi:SH3 domain-containing protein [Clostridium bovifaecis]|uniref:SH3 domain-containing protein n=1 Tax=Clostridium bovifaecis TaxID=2184719 RepID=A0A6I6EZK0_9CLOT|nr:SH3 domain-containing protein [Clostridium bovifaecis]
MLKAKKKIAALVCAAVVAGQLSIGLAHPVFRTSSIAYAQEAKENKKVKNIIMLIPDGMSVESQTIARWYNDIKTDGVAGNDLLAMDSIVTGLVRTYWQDGPITDSAPGGTAYAIGYKSEDKHIGTLSKKDGNIPKATVLESARLNGKATGVVFTSEAMHATPADFTAHAASRSQYNSIMKQMVYSNLDVVLGGGDRLLGPEGMSEDGKTQYRTDGKDLKQELKNMGYAYLTNKAELNSSTATKMWGMFAPQAMSADLDRERLTPNQPTLEEMTNKALKVLSKDKDGFFLLVEGSQVDWAAHANDPSKLAGEIVAFDKAVKAALDFAKKDGNTIVVVCSDHGTGGGTIGKYDLGKDYGKDYASVTFEDTIAKLTTAKASSELIGNELKGKDEATIRARVKELFGFDNLTPEEIKIIQEDNLKKVISHRVGIGWSSNNHTAGDVALYCYAPDNVERLTGLVNNIDVPKYMERVAGLNLSSATDTLFKNAKAEFEKLGATLSINASDLDNPVLVATKNGHTLKLNGFTNLGEFDGTKVKFDAVTVLITEDQKTYNLKDTYVPKDVLTKFEAFVKAGKVVDIKTPEKKPEVKPEVKPEAKPQTTTKLGIVTAKSGLNVRSAASSTGKKLGLLKHNSSVVIIGESGNWYKIKLGNSYGYAFKSYVSLK